MNAPAFNSIVERILSAQSIARQLRSSSTAANDPDARLQAADLQAALSEVRADVAALQVAWGAGVASVPPQLVIGAAPAAAEPLPTLQAVLTEYISVKKRLKPDTAKRYHLCLDRYWPAQLYQPLDMLTSDAFREHFLVLPSPAQANNSLRIIRALFNFYNAAHDASLINPVRKVLKLEGAYPVLPKDRLVSDEDQPTWFAAIEEGSRTSKELFITLALTGLRLGEALRLTWECVDLQKGGLTITETKNGKPLQIPIGERLMLLLSDRKESLEMEAGPVFSINPRNQRFAVTDARKLAGFDWSAHDLRRGFVTTATRLEVPDRMVKRLVNHSEQDVTGRHYVRLSVDVLRPYTQRIEDEFFRMWSAIPAPAAS